MDQTEKNIAHSQTPGSASADVICPACGHFAGVYEACPRCGTYIPKRMSIKFFKFFSLGLAIIGLICMYLWVKNRDLVKIQVSDIKETMNFAYVRMTGEVVQDCKIFYDDEKAENKKPNYLNFSIRDSSGEIRVTAYRHVAQELVSRSLLPHLGDVVDVKGQLRVKANQNFSLIVQALDHIKVIEPAVAQVPLDQISAEHVKKQIKIIAKIKEIQEPGASQTGKTRPYRVMIEQNRKQLPMIVWPDVYAEVSQVLELKVGDSITARVFVDQYKEKLQLTLQKASDVTPKTDVSTKPKDWENGTMQAGMGKEPTSKPAVSLRKISTISKEDFDAKRDVTVEGVIQNIKDVPPGRVLTIQDETGKIDALLSKERFTDQAFLDELKPSIKVQIKGRVRQHRDQWQLSPWNAEDIEILTQKPTGSSTGATIPLGKITAQHLGQFVTVQATVTYKGTVPPGVKLNLQDETGTIDVMLFNKIFKEAPVVWEIEKRGIVRVTGQVAEHKGKFQIQPTKVDDIEIKAAASSTPVAPVEKAPASTGQATQPPPQQTDPAQATTKPSPTKPPEAISAEAQEAILAMVPLEERNLKLEHWDFVNTLGPHLLGKLFRFKGDIVAKEVVPAGTKLIFKDWSGRMPILLRQERFAQSNILSKLEIGISIRTTGILSQLQGELQLWPRSELDVEVLGATSAGAAPRRDESKKAEEVSFDTKKPANSVDQIAALPQYAGQLVTIQGTLIDIKLISVGLKLQLKDETGKIEAMLPLIQVGDLTELRTVFPNSKVQITGGVTKYQQRYQIAILRQDQIVVLEKASANPKKPISEDALDVIDDREP